MKSSQHIVSFDVRKIDNGYILTVNEGDRLSGPACVPKESYVADLVMLSSTVSGLVSTNEYAKSQR